MIIRFTNLRSRLPSPDHQLRLWILNSLFAYKYTLLPSNLNLQTLPVPLNTLPIYPIYILIYIPNRRVPDQTSSLYQDPEHYNVTHTPIPTHTPFSPNDSNPSNIFTEVQQNLVQDTSFHKQTQYNLRERSNVSTTDKKKSKRRNSRLHYNHKVDKNHNNMYNNNLNVKNIGNSTDNSSHEVMDTSPITPEQYQLTVKPNVQVFSRNNNNQKILSGYDDEITI